MEEFPTSIIETLSSGIDASTKRRCLNPLLNSIELALSLCKKNKTRGGITVFSCDSFCEPHLLTQLELYTALKKSNHEIRFCNFPIGHYITHTPDPNLLDLASRPSDLIEINRELLKIQKQYKETVQYNNMTSLINNETIQLTTKYESLISLIEDDNWKECIINGFPFHELAYRDLSLTYKCTPDLACTDQYYQVLFKQVIKFNLWLLCLLICQEEQIGETGVCMSFYTASTVFQFFCDQSKRVFRYFEPAQNWIENFGVPKSKYIRILDTPTASSQLTKKEITEQLNAISLSDRATTAIDETMKQRLKGLGSHTYSLGIDEVSSSQQQLNEWILLQRQLGKKITSLFTSSPDEVIGQQLSFNHCRTDISHLEASVFKSQEDWISQTIEYYSKLADKSPLIIRFHPRLAADKRGLSESPYFNSMWKLISDKCESVENIKLVQPAEEVSSYWLGLESDLILNGWSTIGLEFAQQNKVVTNAFYNCPLGGGAIYPVHLRSPRLTSTTGYLERVDRLLKSIKGSYEINPCDVISIDEARKAFFVTFSSGLTNIAEKAELHAQIAQPKVLTQRMLSILMDG